MSFFSSSVLAQMASWSMATPSLFQSMTLRSVGRYRAPVAGFFCSSTCAYSL
ncbi:MAG: hypothetical protein ACHP7G_04830 [Actinomycetales bacterium]